MKYNFFLILLIVLITSCAPNNYKTVNVDPIFEKFVTNRQSEFHALKFRVCKHTPSLNTLN